MRTEAGATKPVHSARCLRGGGVRGGVAVGTTDEIGKEIVDRQITVPDYFATIFTAMGIDPAKNLYANDRPVPITDHGQPMSGILA